MNVKTFRAIRRLSDRSQTEFARSIGVSRQLVSHIEEGHKSLTKDTANKVRIAFGETYVAKVEEFIAETSGFSK